MPSWNRNSKDRLVSFDSIIPIMTDHVSTPVFLNRSFIPSCIKLQPLVGITMKSSHNSLVCFLYSLVQIPKMPTFSSVNLRNYASWWKFNNLAMMPLDLGSYTLI